MHRIDYSLNGTEYGQSGMLYPNFEYYTMMGYGEYTFETDNNLTAFFEAMYTVQMMMQLVRHLNYSQLFQK